MDNIGGFRGAFDNRFASRMRTIGNANERGTFLGGQSFLRNAGVGKSFMGLSAGNWGRVGGVAALGLYGMHQVGKSYDRLRNGHLLGGVLSAGMAGAAGYALYRTNLLRSVTRSHLMTAAATSNAMRSGIRAGLRAIR